MELCSQRLVQDRIFLEEVPGDKRLRTKCKGCQQEEAVTEAFRIILADERVQGVMVNIFGGIMQCDKIARAIVSSAKEVGFEVPLVVRLEGTNVDEARRILEDARSEIPSMTTATDLADAAKKVCAAVTVTA